MPAIEFRCRYEQRQMLNSVTRGIARESMTVSFAELLLKIGDCESFASAVANGVHSGLVPCQ